MALIDDFNLAVSKSKDLTKRPSNEELLELYGLFKQATEGDVNEPKPMGFDFKAIAKYSAWESKKGIEKDKAMQDYINLMKTLQEHYS
jgi:diazepam-binding inhibitor (GABA receptor modulator, acyl-CoA-binding protein)